MQLHGFERGFSCSMVEDRTARKSAWPAEHRHRQDELLMNNSDLADAIANDHGIAKTDARKIVDAVFDAIGTAAAKGEEVSLNGFGKFKVKDSPEREGRNPATGEAMTIKASKKLTFTAAKAVKDKLNG
jgi:DNA-binding protein HU-beta